MDSNKENGSIGPKVTEAQIDAKAKQTVQIVSIGLLALLEAAQANCHQAVKVVEVSKKYGSNTDLFLYISETLSGLIHELTDAAHIK